MSSRSINQPTVFSDEQFLDAVAEIDTPTTTLVSEHVGCSYALARQRLDELTQDDRVERTKVAQTYLYELPDDHDRDGSEA